MSGARAAMTVALFATGVLGMPAAGEPEHLGVASCASTICHGAAKPRPGPAVQQNEYVTWQHFDPHAAAYFVLTQPRGREIARRLGIVDVTRAPACLACHAEAAEARGPRFQVDDGIGCESCHGAAHRWIASHYDTPRQQHADNVAAGMHALEVTRVRAETCSGCHVSGPGQFATHGMMAAGHPRLAFELDTYTQLWRTSGGREHYRVGDDASAPISRAKPADVWVVGLIVQARRQLALLRQPDARGAGVVPEFALFNCYSCHRQMGLARWASRAGASNGAPGSLQFDAAPLRLVAEVVGLSRPGLAAELRTRVQALQTAPARDWAAVVSAADTLDEGLAGLAAAPPVLTSSDAATLVERLAAAAQRGEFPDYASAEQVAMAIVVLRAHGGRPTQSAAVNELFESLQDDDRFDGQRFRRLLEHASH